MPESKLWLWRTAGEDQAIGEIAIHKQWWSERDVSSTLEA